MSSQKSESLSPELPSFKLSFFDHIYLDFFNSYKNYITAKMRFQPFLVPVLFTEKVFAAQAVLRFGCSQIVVERVDPWETSNFEKWNNSDLKGYRLVNPGKVPSPHVHQVHSSDTSSAVGFSPNLCWLLLGHRWSTIHVVPIFFFILLIDNRMLSAQLLLKPMSPRSQIALPAALAKIFQITGQPICISKLGMGHTSVFPRSPTDILVVRLEAWPFIIPRHMMAPNLQLSNL